MTKYKYSDYLHWRLQVEVFGLSPTLDNPPIPFDPWPKLALLNGREVAIVLGHLSGQTLDQMGELFGITRERVRQQLAHSYSKIRSPNHITSDMEGL